MMVNRSAFIASVAGTTAVAAAGPQIAEAQAETSPVFVNTWSDSFPYLPIAGDVFTKTGSLMDAVEKAINAVENDPNIHTVGYGGYPNADGEVELDAAIMNGTLHRAGSVCSLRTIKTPISVARALMENTYHTTIAGAGALKFAREMGFTSTDLLTPEARAAWEAWKRDPRHQTYWLPGHSPANASNHDTVGVLGYDGKGHVVAGCSTSGVSWKIPGRVADSPLVGCGLYADDNAGAASATGDGDTMTNYCLSFLVVMLMGQGRSPQQACEESLRHMARTDPKTTSLQAAVIAVSNRGSVGAAQMHGDSHFQYGVWRDGTAELYDAVAIVTA
ncbi:MAG TPA: N(4)-(beta-N-acetylglucosaminyl)-L-asparaginase [Candidatus Baltobacteraceae bacterium]|nr:N(4)-(beta-N-acetylglucosaminyl)-L-asparaginase [Candidatus Baltobacteraceae bacterium]